MKEKVNLINEQLANACQSACSACCCKGLLFLPDEEYEEICSWLGKNSPGELKSFVSRSKKYSGFYLYDQKDRCQFLDSNNLCRLHKDKVKPSECYWWPLHVYTNPKGSFEIRVSTSCCEGYKHLNSKSTILNEIQKASMNFGPEIIRNFRNVYRGSYKNKLLRSFSSE